MYYRSGKTGNTSNVRMLTVKLEIGRDDVILDWLMSLPSGQRGAAVRGALLAQIQNAPISSPQDNDAVLAEIRALRDDLRNMVVQQSGEIPNSVEIQTAEQLAEEEIEVRRQRIRQREW